MINIEALRNYCITKKGVTESFPFDSDTLVFKVMDKMFLLVGLSTPYRFNVKCDPEKAVELRDMYDAVQPAYHMSKIHWNTIDLSFDVDESLVWQWIDDSYNLVVDGLTSKQKLLLKGM